MGLEKATEHLLELQGSDGAWEAELGWCPMLTAQYVLVHYIVGRQVDPERCRLLLSYFERSQDREGLWGFHKHAHPHLYITTLVYVAVRLLGVQQNDPKIKAAYNFIRASGITNIPSWGKFWLALLNLYDWRGLNPILPELWSLPRWIPLHPSNWYCHSRLIYMGMAFIYAHRFSMPMTPILKEIRDELFAEEFDTVDFEGSRNSLREADLYVPPTVPLRMAYRISQVFERFHRAGFRKRCLEKLLQQIRWELQGTNRSSLSPLNGLLNIVALWLQNENCDELSAMFEQLERWVWEDEEGGARVALQRTPTWDTGFALQALETVSYVGGVKDAQRRAADYLVREQIRYAFDAFRDAYRTDPRGGWCLGRAWQGWPVSDCTAEALLGVILGHSTDADLSVVERAIRFILRGQNRDGGFGSYEARRTQMRIEWLNPSEMFADAMTEDSYVECTVSCLTALAVCSDRYPELMTEECSDVIYRGRDWLRQNQRKDGSWRGAWGINFIYGTMFGIRGLVATGVRKDDPSLQQACKWLLDRQRDDGGWGEHYSGCLSGQYVPHCRSHVVQTAWALMALLDVSDSNWDAITCGIAFLLKKQEGNGSWPKQEPVGVYARSGVLDYPLYSQYFPIHALGLYEKQRLARIS